MKGLAFAIAILASLQCWGKGRAFRVVGFYSTGTVGYLNPSYAIEGGCIARAAVEQAKREGVNISIDFLDPKWSPITAAEVARQAVAEKYDAAVGTVVSSEALAAAPVLDGAGIPFIVPSGTHPAITQGRDNVVRLPFTDMRQSFLLARVAVQELGAKRVAIVRNLSNPYSQYLAREFANSLRYLGNGIEVSEESVLDDSSDFKGLVRRILSHKPDLVFVPLWEPQVASIYSELRQANANLTLLASDTVDGREAFLKLMGRPASGIRFVFSSYWDGKIKGRFSERYRKLHKAHCAGQPPSRVSVASFDAITMIIEALRTKPTTTRKTLISVIKSKLFDGLTGEAVYGQNGDPKKPIELFTIKDGKVSYWKRYQ